jgi:transcriptional regulator with XRE-family HTH domain
MTFKSLKPKDYSDAPQTLAGHLKKRRRELRLLQREAAKQIGVSTATIVNWENGKAKPTPAQFRPVLNFLGYDPIPEGETFAERVTAKQRALSVTLAQIARYLGWDPGSLHRYIDGTWRMSPSRKAALEAFLAVDTVTLGSIYRLRRQR